MVILVLALLFLGPQRIPEVASSLGKAIRSFRKATRELQEQIDIEDEVRRPLEELRSALRDEPARHREPLLTPPPVTSAPPAPTPPVALAPTAPVPAAPAIAPVPHESAEAKAPAAPPAEGPTVSAKEAEPAK